MLTLLYTCGRVVAGPGILLCFDKTACQSTRKPRCYRTPQLLQVHIGSDRAPGRDVFGVA
jgi:hypothetical protein